MVQETPGPRPVPDLSTLDPSDPDTVQAFLDDPSLFDTLDAQQQLLEAQLQQKVAAAVLIATDRLTELLQSTADPAERHRISVTLFRLLATTRRNQSRARPTPSAPARPTPPRHAVPSPEKPVHAARAESPEPRTTKDCGGPAAFPPAESPQKLPVRAQHAPAESRPSSQDSSQSPDADPQHPASTPTPKTRLSFPSHIPRPDPARSPEDLSALVLAATKDPDTPNPGDGFLTLYSLSLPFTPPTQEDLASETQALNAQLPAAIRHRSAEAGPLILLGNWATQPLTFTHQSHPPITADLVLLRAPVRSSTNPAGPQEPAWHILAFQPAESGP